MASTHEQKEHLGEPLGFALGAAARKLAKFYVQALANHTLTPSQLFLLRQLWLEDGLPLRDLGLRAQLDATSATWLVDQLEHAGLVERKRNDPDRRLVRIWLTEAGRQAQAVLVPALARWEDALLQELLPYHTPGEIATFRQVLATVITTLPEGDDLWERLSAFWDARLDQLRTLTETTDEKGNTRIMENPTQSRRVVEKDVFIHATPERVFQALTEKAELERWFVQTAEIDAHPGGAIRLAWGPGVFESGTIVVFDPPHRLSYTWEALSPSPTTITFELTAENGGTRLRLLHTGIGEGEDWDGYYTSVNGGWNMHLNNLTAWLETGICEPPGPTRSR
jgi:uncharacterized protein YndB with AHSA1/START domain/DNA-binding MarR family transcriptional regulator